MRLMIMSDGTPSGLRVTDEYHNPIAGVAAVSFTQKIGECPTVTLTLEAAQFAMAGEVDQGGVVMNKPEPEPPSIPAAIDAPEGNPSKIEPEPELPVGSIETEDNKPVPNPESIRKPGRRAGSSKKGVSRK